jgi:glycosyltransferase involved in cell wall biosynthesis
LQVSVIIPARNAARFVARAVSSVLGQSHPPSELVIVDDASEDDLAGALAPFRDALKLVRGAGRGAAHARNLGLEATGSECVAFLDADDQWEPEKLARQVEVLRRHPEVGVVSGNFFVERPGAAAREPAWSSAPVPVDRPVPPQSTDLATLVRWFLMTTLLVRRRDLGRDRFDETLATAEDRDLFIRLLARCTGFLISEPLATKLVRPESLSESDPSANYRNMLSVIETNARLLGRGGSERWRVEVLRGWAAAHLQRREFAEAFSVAARAARLAPTSAVGLWTLMKAGVLWTSAVATSSRFHGRPVRREAPKPRPARPGSLAER